MHDTQSRAEQLDKALHRLIQFITIKITLHIFTYLSKYSNKHTQSISYERCSRCI